jgi:predicted Zn-dependent protease with MMP-like domain
MLILTGFINATNNFVFELHTIKPEQCLKLMTFYGYNAFKLIGLYPNCHIAYLFKHRPGLFNNGVRTYSEYVLKGEAVHGV